MSAVGEPENAAHRQASVRNWQGCKWIAPRSRACAGWGPHRPTTGLTHSAAQAPASGPLSCGGGRGPGKTSCQGCRQGTGVCKPLFRVTRRFRNLGEAGLGCSGRVVSGQEEITAIYREPCRLVRSMGPIDFSADSQQKACIMPKKSLAGLHIPLVVTTLTLCLTSISEERHEYASPETGGVLQCCSDKGIGVSCSMAVSEQDELQAVV